ncbi:hypothetical protein KVT40_005190 [Elsinoe batatas]|uniref:Glycine zipper 2TM domain-containing protein n=1 Tax=Elsinoe batatas TaxID=2601811 RepID=A0A8K0L2H7_9PEZI|nr:hypothetical protein KVT40_005190 [Elsinoe batatas]
MSYVYEQRTSSQPPPHRGRYYYSDAEDEKTRAAAAANNQYSDRGRVFARRSWAPPQVNGNLAPPPRYSNPDPYATAAAAGAGAALAPYYRDQQVDRYRRDQRYSRSRSRYRSKSRGRDRSYSSSRSRSSSRSHFDRVKDGTRDALDKTFDTRAKGVGAGIVGALVGGAIGRRMGDKRDNHALAGAIIGGLGLNALENQVHRRRESKREDREWGKWESQQGRRRGYSR